jgi:hypothetical protein
MMKTPSWRWRVSAGPALLAVGCLLLLASLAIPWMRLTNPLVHGLDAVTWDSPGGEVVGLLIGRYTGMVIFSVAFACVVAIIVGRIASQLWRPERTDASGTTVIVIALALVGLGLVGIMLLLMPVGLELGYPYYDVALLGGGFVALAGLLCAIMGAALIKPAKW